MMDTDNLLEIQSLQKTMLSSWINLERALDETDVELSVLKANPDLFELFDSIYTPSKALIKRVEDYEKWCVSRQGEDEGELMEEIAILAFSCLRGRNYYRSGQSEAAEHDLIVSSVSQDWHMLCITLGIKTTESTMVIEAKNIDKPLKDAQLTRLGYLIQNKFTDRCKLGIFFTRSGASGFPTLKKPNPRSLIHARATQIIFYAKTSIKLVVLDHQHIISLKEQGALPRILWQLVGDLTDRLGLSKSYTDNWKENSLLPSHMAKHITE